MLFAVAAAVSPSPRGIVRYRTGNRVSVPRDVAPSVGGGMRRKPRVDDYLYLFVVAIVAIVAIFACPSTPAPALADAMAALADEVVANLDCRRETPGTIW